MSKQIKYKILFSLQVHFIVISLKYNFQLLIKYDFLILIIIPKLFGTVPDQVTLQTNTIPD